MSVIPCLNRRTMNGGEDCHVPLPSRQQSEHPIADRRFERQERLDLSDAWISDKIMALYIFRRPPHRVDFCHDSQL